MPDLPHAVLPVWEWFGELSARRGSSGFGPAPIAWSEIEAWERRNALRLKPHELDWIFALDRLFLAGATPKPSARPGGHE